MLKSSVNFSKLKRLNAGGVVYKNYLMKDHTTFLVGGRAKYYLEIHTLASFIKVVLYLNECKVKPFVLGNGSNVLISDKGYNGVIISLKGTLALIEKTGECQLEVGAGATISKVYAVAQSMDLSGLECGAGIPATIGGMVYMNASAYDFEMSQIVDYVVAFHDGKITYFNRDECKFAYRSSIFQTGEYLIMRVGLTLTNGDKKDIEDKFIECARKRVSSQPLEYPSAGCVFKRLDGLNVSKMLDDGGFKGMKIGGAEVSNKHANFIINSGNAIAQDIYDLINKIKLDFYEKYKVELDTEIKFLGEFDETTR